MKTSQRQENRNWHSLWRMRIGKCSLFFGMSSGKDSSFGEWRLRLFQVTAFLCQLNCLAFGERNSFHEPVHESNHQLMYSCILIHCLFFMCILSIYSIYTLYIIQCWIWRTCGRESLSSRQWKIHENTAHYLQLRYCQVPDKFVEIWTKTSNIHDVSAYIIYRIASELKKHPASVARPMQPDVYICLLHSCKNGFLLSNCTCAEKNSRLRLEMKPSQAVLWVSMIFLHIWYHSPCNFENGKSPVSEIIPVFLQPALVWIKLRYFS